MSPIPTRKVILVDDHEDSLLMLHTANNGISGLQLAEQCQADAMVVDIVMPSMNGFEVAKRAREKFGPKITLIALSGYGERNNRQKGIEAGFNHYLIKPVTADNLVPYIDR